MTALPLPRREVRLSCLMEVGSSGYLARTTDLSEGSFSLQLEERPLPADLVIGAQVGFQLLLRPEETVSGTGRIAWIDPDDRDAKDRPVSALGVEIAALDPEGRERLAAFVRDFRYAVVVLDEDPECAELYAALEEDYRLFHLTRGEEALKLAKEVEIAAFLVSERLPEYDCLTFFQTLNQRRPRCTASRVVLCEYTAAGQLQMLVNVGRLFSYLRKPFGARLLHQTVRRAVDAYVLANENRLLREELSRANARLERENAYLRQRLAGDSHAEGVVGRSAELARATAELARVQRVETTVHLSGETGTGKELFARAIHQGSRRRSKPFVTQSCAAISGGLVQSTLFGYLKGAFTGADHDHPGIFEQADGGTLFLDEVSELGPEAQAALLRVLQEGEVQPLGASKPQPVDVRVLSAANKDLRAEVAAGRFREDLYYRLMVVPIRIPSLRERREDIPLLAVHFLDLCCDRQGKDVRGFTLEAMRILERYPWPGNVRELANEIERAVVMADEGGRIHAQHLSPALRPEEAAPAPETPAGGLAVPRGLGLDAAVEHLERALISRALEASGGNVSRAAALLEMDRTRLSKLKLRLFGPA